jgi:membrane associated rhomboid family serine protease
LNPLIDSDTDSLAMTRQHFLDSLRFPLIAVMVLWAVHIYQVWLEFDPGLYGIIPRWRYGLRGIVTAPLMHGGWKHLISNTFPMFILSGLTFFFYRKVAWRAFWVIYFGTGLSVWLFSPRVNVSHIGASGVVYGLLSFLFFNGIFRRSLRSVILASIVLFLYSGMFEGILPNQPGISWESHLWGGLVGIMTSFWFKSELEDEEMVAVKDPFADERNLEKEYFLPRDAFETTKLERQAAAEEAARRAAEDNDFRQFFPPFWRSDWTI